MMTRALFRRASSAVTALMLTACGSSSDGLVEPKPTQKPAATDTITVQSWRRSPLFLAPTLSEAQAQLPASFLTVATNALTAVNPQTGANSWSLPLATSLRDVRTTGGVVRVTQVAANGNDNTESFLDEATGNLLWSQLSTPRGGSSIVAASAAIILSNIGDTLFVGRERSTGTVRWTARAPFGPCVLTFDDCWVHAGRATDAFYLVRAELTGTQQRLMKITDAGVATVTPFADPLARGFTILTDVTIDSTGSLLFITSFGGVSAIDASTGAVRWAARNPFPLDAVLLQPVVSIARGNNPMIHLLYPFESDVNGGFAREFVLDANTGTTVRSRTLPTSTASLAYIGPCGVDGMVVVRGNGRFSFSNTRTGSVTEGMIRNAGTNTITEIIASPSVVGTFATGHLVLSNRNGELTGFRCRP
jgi:outer membrane protein assembly factor BamB